jgi:hypothetical protein
LAPRSKAGRALATAGRVGGGVVGVGMTGFSVIGAIGVLVAGPKDGIGAFVGAWIFVALTGGVGLALSRWAFRPRRAAPARAAVTPSAAPGLAVAIRQRMLAVASHYGGRITAAELAAALGIEEAPAARALEAAAETGEARMLFSPEGIPVYEFVGLVAHKAEAKEPWEL